MIALVIVLPSELRTALEAFEALGPRIEVVLEGAPLPIARDGGPPIEFVFRTKPWIWRGAHDWEMSHVVPYLSAHCVTITGPLNRLHAMWHAIEEEIPFITDQIFRDDGPAI